MRRLNFTFKREAYILTGLSLAPIVMAAFVVLVMAVTKLFDYDFANR